MTAQVSNEEIDEAILRALPSSGDDQVAWKAIEPRVPGTFWRKAEACTRLYVDGDVYFIKIFGTPYMRLADILDAELAARYRAQGCTRPLLVM